MHQGAVARRFVTVSVALVALAMAGPLPVAATSPTPLFTVEDLTLSDPPTAGSDTDLVLHLRANWAFEAHPYHVAAGGNATVLTPPPSALSMDKDEQVPLRITFRPTGEGPWTLGLVGKYGPSWCCVYGWSTLADGRAALDPTTPLVMDGAFNLQVTGSAERLHWNVTGSWDAPVRGALVHVAAPFLEPEGEPDGEYAFIAQVITETGRFAWDSSVPWEDQGVLMAQFRMTGVLVYPLPEEWHATSRSASVELDCRAFTFDPPAAEESSATGTPCPVARALPAPVAAAPLVVLVLTLGLLGRRLGSQP